MKRLIILSIIFSCHAVLAQDNLQRSKMLRYSNPEFIGLDSTVLYAGIDSIVLEALDSGAFPGCQVLLAKGGEVFFHKAYGYHTYDSLRLVNKSDIYDLASITKILATGLGLMYLVDKEELDLDATLGQYFPEMSKSDKNDLMLRKVLAHHSRLKNWIPFYQESKKKNGKYKSKTVSQDSSRRFPKRIPGSDLFLHKDYYRKHILKMIAESPLYEDEQYVYSGLSFYLFPRLIERIEEKDFDQFLTEMFYQPMGCSTLGFSPAERFPSERIVPTEVDTFFRMNQLHGVVHDEGAAMMLGVSGNAGLFGNSWDVAQMMQMLLNRGVYDGKRYLSQPVIEEFTRCQYCKEDNRRGLCFDKPLIAYDSIKTSVAKLASPDSFGHSGYTGTLVWSDPVNDLTFVFLSNRVHPSRDNRMLYQLNVRPRIHDLIYNLLEAGGQ